MEIGEIVEIGERIVETPKLNPAQPERERSTPAPAPAKREKEDA